MGEIHKCYCNTRFFLEVFFFAVSILKGWPCMWPTSAHFPACHVFVLTVTTQRYLAHQGEAHPPRIAKV